MEPFDLMCHHSHPRPVVKASQASGADLDFDESLIDRILGTPDKIQIPERYIPEESEHLEPEEEKKRLLKAERICRLLSKSNGGNLPLVLPPNPNPKKVLNHVQVNGHHHHLTSGGNSSVGQGASSVPSSPARGRLISVKKGQGSGNLIKRRPSSNSATSLCDWSLAGVLPPTQPSWRGNSSTNNVSASERLFGAPVPPAFGIGEHCPIPYEKGVVIGGSKVDYFKASVHHQHQPSASSLSSSSGRSSASADREDLHLLHLQQYLAREVTEKSRVVAINALSSPNTSNRNSIANRYRDPSPPSPVELPTVQQREGFFT
ncbi:uncharacterized protein LOC110857979 isoform X2 [Folsomia candida]|uniref:uncharacterized protein LOC110857979 isoform X2 n=1 Tax=Folsomia candida TaxID=158441 RepID=UPI000B8FB4B1|nr:uncharacterized protein LOC110857979 isoform X2 [Folsomia candida]